MVLLHEIIPITTESMNFLIFKFLFLPCFLTEYLLFLFGTYVAENPWTAGHLAQSNIPCDTASLENGMVPFLF